MKKKVIITLIILVCIILIGAVFVYLNRTVIFQRGNPIPYLSKAIFLSKSDPYKKVFKDKEIYISKNIVHNEEVRDGIIKFVENKYNVNFIEQAGSAYIFQSENYTLVMETEIYLKYYNVWKISSTPRSKLSESDYNLFLKLLTDSNFNYTEGDYYMPSYFSVICKPIFIGEEIISIYEHSSNEDMEKEASYIDNGGCSISLPGREINISWASYPHFFKKSTLIINYVGQNKEILEFLTKNYGDEFAGYGFVNR